MNSGGTIKQENGAFQPNNSAKGKRANVKGRAVNMAHLSTTLGTGYPQLFDLLSNVTGETGS